jgi:hypothetical protein
MAMKLPVQTFVALAAVGWVDGALTRSEATALVDAAKKVGVSGTDLHAVDLSTKGTVALDAFDPGAMTHWERVVTYALASWLAGIDGIESRDESAALRRLGERLGLELEVRRRAAAVAFDISVLPDGGRPDRYDFSKLEGRLRERMPLLMGLEVAPAPGSRR